jgi:phosphoribosyl-AMP cyclohydrolase / phosphoribosyl-ATP pyrophosphohydrolase
MENLNFEKSDGLLPAIIVHFETMQVLMLGYMNREAYELTNQSGKVTFFSRSRNTLWQKGETSGNQLLVQELRVDCDGDTLLIKAQPTGPVCHTGDFTCFQENDLAKDHFIYTLEKIIQDRKNHPTESSYTNSLFQKGINKIAQKVGEEAVELVIEAKDNNRDLFLGEAADLMYHFLVLLAAKEVTLSEVSAKLSERHQPFS